MQEKKFAGGSIRSAHYDEPSGHLELHWANGSALAYKCVPHEVYRRLCSAPSPAAYWEDRIAEEYPKATVTTKAAAPGTGKSLADLFGPAPSDAP